MEIIKDYVFWIILLGSILVLFLIRILTRKPNLMRSMYEQTVEISSTEKSVSLLQEAMKRAGFKDVNFNSEDQKFYASTSFSMSSWFEHIEIKMIPLDNKLQLHFSSICGYPYQIYDWGKNKENFERFQKELMKMT
jgi:hypothetical protein